MKDNYALEEAVALGMERVNPGTSSEIRDWVRSQTLSEDQYPNNTRASHEKQKLSAPVP